MAARTLAADRAEGIASSLGTGIGELAMIALGMGLALARRPGGEV